MKNHRITNYPHCFRRMTAALLVLTFVFTFCFSSRAQAATASRRVETSDVTGTFYSVTTTAINTVRKPFYQTQAEHRRGVETTISVSHEASLSVEASASISATVGVSYLGIISELCTELGIAQTSTVGIDSKVSYTIESPTPDGMYRIEAVFPQYKTRFYIYTYGANGITVKKDKTITKVPSQRDAYHKLNRYSDIID